MIILALLSIVQIAFLPGFLILRLGAIRLDWSATMAASFLLSQMFNHILVMVAVTTGMFGRGFLLAAIALEVLLVAFLVATRMPVPRCPPVLKATAAAGSALSAVALLYFAVVVFGQMGTVFQHTDSVFSWNRWALDWAAGNLPSITMNYPQLLPTNWAVIYCLLGEPIQFFSKSVMPIYPLAMVLMLIKVAVDAGRPWWLLIPVVGLLLVARLFGQFFAEGMADLPIAAFSVAAFAFYHESRRLQQVGERRSRLLLSVLFLLGAIATKQAGLYLLLFLPIIIGDAWSAGGRDDNWRGSRTLLAAIAVTLLATAAWYGFKLWQVNAGIDRDVSQFLIDAANKRPIPARLVAAWDMLDRVLTPPVFPLLCIVGLFGVFHPALDRRTRAFVVLGVAYLPIWALFFNYDLRNAALALPFLAIAIGLGCAYSGEVLLSRLGWLRSAGILANARSWLRTRLLEAAPALPRFRWFAALLVVFLSLLVLFRAAIDDSIRRQYDLRSRAVGDPSVNARLYELLGSLGSGDKLITNYRYLKVLPEIGQHYHEWHLSEFDRNKRPFVASVEAFDAYMDSRCADCRYLLLIAASASAHAIRLSPEVAAAMEQRVRSGSYRTRFDDRGITLLELRSP